MSYTLYEEYKKIHDENKNKANRLLRFIKKLSDAGLTSKNVNFYSNRITIEVNDIDELTEVRRKLRVAIKGYKDKLAMIYPYYANLGIASYDVFDGDSKINEIIIHLVSPIEGFPVNVGEGCGFSKVKEDYSNAPKERWVYKCEKGGA